MTEAVEISNQVHVSAISPDIFNSSPLKMWFRAPKGKLKDRLNQASFFRGELLNFGGVS